MEKDQWLRDRIAIIAALSKKSEAQELLLELHALATRNPEQQRDYDVLVRAEKAAAKAERAATEASTLASKKREAERKARAHEMIQVAGLLALVKNATGEPLLDSKTGQLAGIDKATLLGLLSMGVRAEKQRHEAWRAMGETLLTEQKPKAREEKPETNQPEPQKAPPVASPPLAHENPQAIIQTPRRPGFMQYGTAAASSPDEEK